MMQAIEHNDYAFSEEQLLERKKSIGASECASALGIQGAFNTPIDIWRDKTNPEAIAGFSTSYTRRGNILEEYVIKGAEIKWGKEIIHNQTTAIHPEKSFLTATPDGWYEDAHPAEFLVQIKTSTEKQLGNYGVEGTAEVPLKYLFQCYHEMLVTGAGSVDLIVYFAKEEEFDAVIYMSEKMAIEQVGLFISNQQLKKYHIERNDDRLLRLEQLLTVFWQCVVDKKMPVISQAEAIIFNEPPIEEIKVSGNDLGIALDWIDAKQNAENANAILKECRNELDERLRIGTIWKLEGIDLQYKRSRPISRTDWESLAKHSFVDKASKDKLLEIINKADLLESTRLAIIKGVESNDLSKKLEDRFIKSANSKKRPINSDIVNAFVALAMNCRIEPEIVMEYTTHYPGAKKLYCKKEKTDVTL